MKIRRPILAPGLAALLLLATSRLPAQTYTLSTSSPSLPAMAAFQINVKLTSPAKCGMNSVLLPAGIYAVKIESLGGSSVRGTFSGNGKTCQAPGTLTAMTSSQSPTTLSTSTTQTYATLGFTSQSQVIYQKVGTKLNVIVKGLGSNQILIGLTLPS
jgi:hypothetical protein